MKNLISSLLVLVAVVALVAVGCGGAGSSTGGKKNCTFNWRTS